MDPDNPKCSEDSAYPAESDSEYGWEKLFSERLYFSFHSNYDWILELQGFIIFLDLKEPGREERKSSCGYMQENCPGGE